MSLGAVVIAPTGGDDFWPVTTRWRAVVEADGGFQTAEWMLTRVKPVPLSSRNERELLDAVRADDGRTVLERASEPGEHRVAAATVAALRLARDHPERAIRFLGWIRQSPDDPGDLRFLRRYLPGLHVLVCPDPELGIAVPLSHDALGLLAAELFRTAGAPDRADQVLSVLAPSAPVALARASVRLARGDLEGVHAVARDRPIVDDVSAALRIVDADACERAGDPAAALTILDSALDHPDLTRAVQRMGRVLRARALQAAGREVEASLVDQDFGTTAPVAPGRTVRPEDPEPPLFGRSLADAMEDARARVRRQSPSSPQPSGLDPESVDTACEEALVLIRAGHDESAEAELLTQMDRVDAAVDAGGAVIEEVYVLLAGLFAQQGLTVEEVAALERLWDAHRRAGSEPSAKVVERLNQAVGSLQR